MKLLLPGVPTSPATRSAAPLPSPPPTSAPYADVERFLRVEVKHEHSVPARSRAGVQPLVQTAVEVGDNDVVELEFGGGFRQWLSVAQLARDMEASGQRSADGAVPVPLQPIMLRPQQSRGVTEWVLKGLKVLGISPVDAAVDEIQSRVLASFEKNTAPKPGLWRLRTPQDPAEQLTKPFAEPEKPALIFIHGTASSIAGSFCGLAEKSEKLADVWADLKTQYGDRIFGFQHPTLSVSPVENAFELIKLIPEGARLHLVSHSRGGLVGELLCLNGLDDRQIKVFQDKASAKDATAPANEQPERKAARDAEVEALRELATKLHERKLKIERFVRVACPARGTILASGRLDLFLSILTSAIGLLADKVPALGEVHDFTKAVVLEVAHRRTRPDQLPGFEAQMPDSPLIHLLNQSGFASTADLAVIAGDIEGGNVFAGDSLAKWLGVFATDLFYWEDHDIVVNTSSMDGGLRRQNGVRQLLDQGTMVSHFSYFHNPRTRDALSHWLRRKDGAPDDAEFAMRPTRAAVSRAAPRASRDTAGFPVLFILPGIMGTLLGEGKAATKEDLLWLNQERLALGGLRQLELTGSNSVVVVPVAAVGENYDAISQHFSTGYEVEVFGYDWRQSVIESGKLLARKVHAQVEKGRAVRLLAHSMGGLVARAMIASDLPLWDRVCAGGGRLVQLGTPNRGSYAIPRVLWGVDETVRMLDLIDPAPVDELCAIFARWPGVLEMLPEEASADKSGELAFGRFFNAGWWSRHRPAAAPSNEALEAARLVREMLNSTPLKNGVYVAGRASETPGGLVLDEGLLPVWTAAEGDGTVPYALARLQRSEDPLDVYFLDAIHGDLANHPPGFEAISELLAKGQTNKLPKTLPVARGPDARDAVLRDDAPLLFPREEELLTAALRSRPRRRGLKAPELPLLEVTVFHGDLRLSRHPVIIGHYLGDKIVHAEKTLDEQLEGALTQHHSLGLYTGAAGEAEVVLVPSCQPPGALVLGLGEVGDLSARQLERSVRTAALRYGMRLAKQPLPAAADGGETKRPPAGLSVLLIGTNGGSPLRIIDSAAAIIAGVRDANRLLRDTLPPAERVCIEVLHFIELYETLATRALYAVQRVCARFSAELSGRLQAVRVAPLLRSLGIGRFQPSLDDLDTGWWPRVIITGEKNAAGQPAGLRFAMASDRGAGIEERVARTQARHIESRIQRGITSPNFDVTAAATLFELLVPESLKVRLDTASDNVVLLLDEQSARIPWEVLTRRSAEAGGGGLDHLALRIGIVRQFRTAAVAMRKPASRALKAVVIGDTKNEFAELPGAQREAKDVAALLMSRGVDTTPLFKAEGDEALDAILAPDYRILHIAAHGQYDTEVERSGVVLGADLFFSPLEVEAMPAAPEVVFINCCHLGLLAPGPAKALVSDKDYEAHLARLRQVGNLAASLAFAFIKKGTRAVIAAGWAVDDAAASFFATTFYKAILAGECFGEAVLHARQATAEAHPRVNTWCAYQCYGSPDFRFELERDGAPPVTAAKAEGGSPFVARTEFLHAIRELRLEITISQPASAAEALFKNARERLERLAQMVPAHWQDGEMLAEIGFAFVEMREWDQARHWLGLAMRHGNATASLRAIEQLCNVEDRAAKGLDPAAAAALRERAGARMALLRQFGETAERHALQGGWMRRRMDAVSESEKDALLREARDEYRKADELTRRERSEIDPYPAINWLTYAWLLLDGAPSPEKNAIGQKKTKRRRKTAAFSTDGEIDLAMLRRELATVRGAVENRLLAESDFWTRVHAPDALLLHHLVEGSLAHSADGTKLQVIAAYRSALRTGVQAGQKSSITSHLDFLIDRLSGQAATVAALTEIRDSIEKI